MVEESKKTEAKSPLKIKLEQFGDMLTYVIGAICVFVWAINYKNFFDANISPVVLERMRVYG